MSARPHTRAFQFENFLAWGAAAGYSLPRVQPSLAITGTGPHDLTTMLDHAFVALRDGQRVLVGDAYTETATLQRKAAAFAEEFGLEFEIGPGCWCPGSTNLAIFSVIDPARARPLFSWKWRQSPPLYPLRLANFLPKRATT